MKNNKKRKVYVGLSADILHKVHIKYLKLQIIWWATVGLLTDSYCFI